MKVIIAIDSFKESVSSIIGSQAISEGIKEVYSDAEVLVFPLADGGEGTVEALVIGTGGKLMNVQVTGPLGEKTEAFYGVLGDGKTAVIEVAAACGLPLLTEKQRNPLKTTSFGVGELITDALEKGCREFIVGLGGSATNDAGVGMLQALGFQFKDQKNEELGYGGQYLQETNSINTEQVHPLLKKASFKVACDVNNFLYGEEGAAYIYGPQKGASNEMVEELDKGLKHFAEVVEQKMAMDIHHMQGAGAAGGLGAAFLGFLGAELQSGADLILETVGLEEQLAAADFVITGEGKMDAQTSRGKAPLGVAKLAKKHNVPVIALAGAVTEETADLNDSGITSYFSIVNSPMSLEDAMDREVTYLNLKTTAKQLFRLVRVIKNRELKLSEKENSR